MTQIDSSYLRIHYNYADERMLMISLLDLIINRFLIIYIHPVEDNFII